MTPKMTCDWFTMSLYLNSN